ncbi:hypothetical protein CDL60_07485 [Roseateles noduli]|nr:hypothetical protein CDL60_07485 [Roseateles noduli]
MSGSGGVHGAFRHCLGGPARCRAQFRESRHDSCSSAPSVRTVALRHRLRAGRVRGRVRAAFRGAGAPGLRRHLRRSGGLGRVRPDGGGMVQGQLPRHRPPGGGQAALRRMPSLQALRVSAIHFSITSMTTTMKLSPVVLAFLMLPLCGGAQAQSGAANAPTSTIVVQAGVAVSTRYAGSDERMIVPLLGVEYAHASGFFASTQRGIGYAGSAGALSYGAALGYRGKREEKKTSGLGFSSGSKYLRGMGEVEGSATANLMLSYAVMERLQLQAATEQPVSNRENGALYSVGAAATLIEDGKNTVVLSMSANAGDKKYMQTYHGVTAAQSARSGYAAYTPKAGAHLAEAGVSWQHKLSSEWSVTAMAGAQTLLGDAKKSPLTRRTTSPVGAVYVSYSY